MPSSRIAESEAGRRPRRATAAQALIAMDEEAEAKKRKTKEKQKQQADKEIDERNAIEAAKKRKEISTEKPHAPRKTEQKKRKTKISQEDQERIDEKVKQEVDTLINELESALDKDNDALLN